MCGDAGEDAHVPSQRFALALNGRAFAGWWGKSGSQESALRGCAGLTDWERTRPRVRSALKDYAITNCDGVRGIRFSFEIFCRMAFFL